MHEKNEAYATVAVNDHTTPLNPPTGDQPMHNNITGDITKVYSTITTCYYAYINVREVKLLSILMLVATLLLLTIVLLVMFL